MDGGRAGRQGNDLLVFVDELFQIVFKTIDIGTQGYHPVGIESFFDEFLLLSRHVSQAEVNSVVCHFIYYFGEFRLIRKTERLFEK